MNNELSLQTSHFVDLEERESTETNGGGIVLPLLGGVVLALVVNEVVERTTGKSIVTHIGNGLTTVGNFLKK